MKTNIKYETALYENKGIYLTGIDNVLTIINEQGKLGYYPAFVLHDVIYFTKLVELNVVQKTV